MSDRQLIQARDVADRAWRRKKEELFTVCSRHGRDSEHAKNTWREMNRLYEIYWAALVLAAPAERRRFAKRYPRIEQETYQA